MHVEYSQAPVVPAAQESVSAVPFACPHCGGDLPARWLQPRAGRCPVCRLLIGAGRSVSTSLAGPRGRAGSAAGMLASAARRTDAVGGDPEVVAAALRAAAARSGCDVTRLRMLDYMRLRGTDLAMPALDVVLATFTTWKRARATAAGPGAA